MNNAEAKPSTFDVIGVLAAQVAAGLSLLTVLSWHIDFLRLATGWVHPQDFDNWDHLFGPALVSNFHFVDQPAFWLQIIVAHIILILWMVHRRKHGMASPFWLLPSLLLVPAVLINMICAFLTGAIFWELLYFSILLFYTQPLVVMFYASKNKRLTLILSLISTLLLFCIRGFIEFGSYNSTPAVHRLLSWGMSPNAQTRYGITNCTDGKQAYNL